MMQYIVMDLEWNQFMSPKEAVRKPLLLTGEIIQIGAVKLNDKLEIVDRIRLMVKPRYYLRMHWKVSKLTGIKTGELKKGMPFPEAAAQFREWCGEEFIFLTWGPNDIEIFRENMELHGLDQGWLPRTYNVQAIFADQVGGDHRQYSLADAVVMVHGEEESAEKAHDALDDAWNTAVICRHMDMERGLRDYEQSELRLQYGDDPPVDRCEMPELYATRRKALSDQALFRFYAEALGENVVCTRAISLNGTVYIGLGLTESGRELFLRYRLRKRVDGLFVVTRVAYELDEERRDYYEKWKKKAGRNILKVPLSAEKAGGRESAAKQEEQAGEDGQPKEGAARKRRRRRRRRGSGKPHDTEKGSAE